LRRKQHRAEGESPACLDQGSHTYYDRYLDEDRESTTTETEEDDEEGASEDDSEDALEDEVPGGKTVEGQLEVISSYESDEGDDDETEYNSVRARPGDNTTGVTKQILVL